jgi:superfamily II DNA or RNA helicase
MRPFIRGMFYIPLDMIKSVDILQQKLTVRSKYYRDMQGNITPPIHVFDMQESYIGVPLRFGIDKWKSLYGDTWQSEVDDFSSLGTKFVPPRMPDLNHEKAHPEQKNIVPQTMMALIEHRASMLIAATGTGKSVMGLYIAGSLGMKTVIIVNKNQLKLQWIKEITDNLGILKSDIGIIQGDKCEVDKPIVIAMLQTIYTGKYTEIIQDKFGFTIYDEVHNLGADQFSKALGIINSRYALGMTATDDRPDGKDKVFKLHFGSGDVTTKSDALPIKVHVLEYMSRLENWGRDRTGKIKCLSLDVRRNKLIADLIVESFKAGRQIVVFSDYKKHLKTIFDLAVEGGLDPKAAGHFYLDGEKLQNSEVPLKQAAYFEHIKLNAQVLFATYGMMREGISIDRLDLGIDATPQSKATQLIGRIRRPFKNKPLPIWYTINDINDPVLAKYSKARIKEYLADNTVELIRHDQR